MIEGQSGSQSVRYSPKIGEIGEMARIRSFYLPPQERNGLLQQADRGRRQEAREG